MSESIIQKQILKYLEVLQRQGKLYCFRAQSGAVKLENGRFMRTGKRGLPDIVVCYGGQFIGIEVKTPKGRQSEWQKRAESEIKQCGGAYIIATCLDDVINLFK